MMKDQRSTNRIYLPSVWLLTQRIKSRLILVSLTLVSLLLAGCSLPSFGDLVTPSAVIPEPALPTLTILPSSTATSIATGTALPTATETLAPAPTQTPDTATLEQVEALTPRFGVQPGTPLGTVNFVEPSLGCSWMGVGGQVFDMQGKPISHLVVEIGGTLNGQDVLGLAITSGSTLLGPGGYVIKLADLPVTSQGTLWLQVSDFNGVAQSNRIPFSTSSECGRNLTLINLAEQVAQVEIQVRLPQIFK